MFHVKMNRIALSGYKLKFRDKTVICAHEGTGFPLRTIIRVYV